MYMYMLLFIHKVNFPVLLRSMKFVVFINVEMLSCMHLYAHVIFRPQYCAFTGMGNVCTYMYMYRSL